MVQSVQFRLSFSLCIYGVKHKSPPPSLCIYIYQSYIHIVSVVLIINLFFFFTFLFWVSFLCRMKKTSDSLHCGFLRPKSTVAWNIVSATRSEG